MFEASSALMYNLSLTIEEGMPAGTILGDLSALLPENTSSSGFFISESRESYVFKDLEINGNTGVIATAVVLDRESRDKYEFVAATLTGEVIKVRIEVQDVNDHSPAFRRDTVVLNISEQSPPGTRFHLEGAHDEDEGGLGTQGYRIIDNTVGDLFKVECRSGGQNLFNLDLVLSGKLDREIKDFYAISIEAFDGGVPCKTGSLQVEVYVLDENDNTPVFSQSKYHALLREDAALLTSVCQVYATDSDLGRNGQVVYEISRRLSDPRELFVIDSATGLIRVNNPLDYESQPYHELIVRARDNGIQPEYTSTLVAVTVLNVNDNRPTINIMFLSESGAGEVSEGVSMGHYVARISVYDPDLGEVNGVRASLEGGDGKFTLKRSDEFVFSLCVSGELDREKSDVYELTIVASDFGAPSLSSERTFLLRVTDENDSPPVFEKHLYIVNISEDAFPGSTLLHVRAGDLDEGVNSVVRYSMMKPDQGFPFHIDSEAGLVTTETSLDHEQESEFHFSVVAVDSGSPPLSSTASVTVYVEDINDNRPVFEKQVYNVFIPEHLAIGSCVLQVTALDTDGDAFGVVRYSLRGGLHPYDRRPPFRVHPNSGSMCICQDLDRDAGTVDYNILVRAEDPDGLSAQVYVHIEIEDINDNRPIFSPEVYTASISSYSLPGTDILSVFATDRDAGIFGHVSYDLLPGDFSYLFIVDQSTGGVSLSSSLSHLSGSSVRLSVSARDGVGLVCAHPADITVHILHSSPAPAVFQKSHYTFVVSEDTPAGSTVGTVRATSTQDSPESLSYTISSGDPQGLFSVHPHSGLISTRGALDRETQPYFLLILQCQGGASPVHTSTRVNITVADVNDNLPIFFRDRQAVTVTQGTVVGTALFIAHAHDRDAGSNGSVSYHLLEDVGDAVFSVDTFLGTVFLKRSLPLDGPERYFIRIQAQDEGTPTLSSTMTLSVTVESLAANDTLTFDALVYKVEISESAALNSQVIQTRAHGQYRSTPTGVSYSLPPSTLSLPFRIHHENGWIFLAQGLDFESVPRYHFTVLATKWNDCAPQQASATVIITVLDENDNAPIFTHNAYFYTVQEGPFPKGLMGTVRATDKDSGKNSQLSYFLLSDGKHFQINPNTGELVSWIALDREQHTHHFLKVLVIDHGHPGLSATAHVHVLVTDVNDNPPQFTSQTAGRQLSIQFWAGSPAGSLVTTVHAEDVDAGENGTVHYFLMSDDPGHFKIDGSSGEIRTTGRFSESEAAHYVLTAVAADSGPVPLKETIVIHLQVHSVEWVDATGDRSKTHNFRHFSVREDIRPGTIIGYLGSAADHDVPSQYSVAESDGGLRFGIDATSGGLYVSQELDYESATQHFLRVRVESSGRRSVHNHSLLVGINVEDVNDHTPRFPDDVLTFGVLENLPTATFVYTFNAGDRDGTAANSGLSYSISADPNLPFIIHPFTGTLSTARPIDREAAESFVFTVTAIDQAEDPSERRKASLTVQVFVQDVNDHSPVFMSSDSTHVFEDTAVGTLVHHFVARDDDLGENGQLTFIIESGNEDGLFVLEDKTGLLHLARSLDYELANFHAIVMKAVDAGQPPHASTQHFMVAVLDVNDQAPEFEHSVYTAAVAENRESGEHVIKVTAFDRDSDVSAAVSYSLLPGPGFRYFTIDPNTGEIRTAAQLDRELQESFPLLVLARDSGTGPLSGTTTVLCTVLDDNDNTPRFSRPTPKVSVPETLPPGVIYIAQADDADTGPNGDIRYGIEGDTDGCFAINVTSGAVSTLRSLDREKRSSYTIIIEAHDQGAIPRSSLAKLQVLVLDENDNSPVFSQEAYHVSISEGAPAGSEILQVIATDNDQGSNGEVTFSLLEDTLGMFSIDESIGILRTARLLNREAQGQYTFHVTATDGCSQGPRSSIATVTVDIEDVNDNAPAFAENLIVCLVSKDTVVNQTIVTMVAGDGDLGNNGTVTFGLSESDKFFSIDRNTGEIRPKASLSPGIFVSRLLHVIASDLGVPSLSSSSLLLIHLEEEPKLRFTEDSYMTSIPENSKTGSWIVTVVAVGQGTNQWTIKYSIFNGNDDKAFAINQDTGDVSVNKETSLDFEQKKEVRLVVLADNGQETTHSVVVINVLDVNDSAPMFKQTYYRTAVWEGQAHDTYIMQVFADDADSGVNGQIDYFILSGNHNGSFLIETTRGILATSAVLDREVIPSYKLVLQAVDRGTPRLTGTTTVQIQVVDVNDNTPVITPMEPITIAENLPAGHMVTQVMASDMDLSSSITYSFAEWGSSGGQFTIDPYTGIITLTRSLDHEDRSEHTLRIRASDSVHQTEAEVKVLVLDANDNPPVFTEESYQVLLPELTSADTSVLTLSASDRDSGLNGIVTYRLVSPPTEGFFISPVNGSVYTSRPLRNITSGSTIEFLVEASDGGDPALEAVTSVYIHVADANDHAPRFNQATYQVTVAEDAAVGTTLLLLSAEDQDWSWQNTRLIYTITGGDEDQRFCMEVSVVQSGPWRRSVGKLVLRASLDREVTDSYTLTVTAFDGGQPPLDGSALVKVTMLDVNDNTPAFESMEYHVRLSERSPPGTMLTRVLAQDLDQGPNAQIQYEIISGNSIGCFRMDHLSGSLVLNQSLDYEEDARFALTIQASDGDGLGRRNVAFSVVHISVLDENDNFPYFTFPVLNCIVTENQPTFSPVCAVQAVDLDAGPSGHLTYSILSSCFLDYESGSPETSQAFAIDAVTGNIHTAQVLDYERESQYCVLVEARDIGDQTATVRVEIDVQGEDEFSPFFTQHLYLFQLPEEAEHGQIIGQVEATDRDGGLDGVVEYSLVSPSMIFSVNKTSGTIHLSDTLYRRERRENLVKLLLKAGGPKLDSRSASCLVTVNISGIGATMARTTLDAQTISLSIFLTMCLLLLVSFLALLLRQRERRCSSPVPKQEHSVDTCSRMEGPDIAEFCDFSNSMDLQVKGELTRSYGISDSSGRGSAEGETAEDKEIKMINEHPCQKSAGSVLSDMASRVPNSGVPRESDQLSSPSEYSDVEPVTMAVGTVSFENLHTLSEEGVGEGRLTRRVRLPDSMDSVRDDTALSESQISMGGSLASLVCGEEEIQGSYSWDYLLDWEPQFQPLASVFSDIGLLPDGAARTHSLPKDSLGFLQPPPLITSVAHPSIRAVAPRMPLRTSTMAGRPSFPKHSYSPLGKNTGLTPTIMTPSFSPAISLLTMRTPSASPLVSETGLGGPGRACSHLCKIADDEIKL
ncbi:protocadherin-23 [Brienomyrus brachyistius]|uniref:protocadherin-23 n=1 Tax=Brienomyrus brachyistius TaxID=42636 RepID=UPI0020B3C66F|nr:protocadherin-23 [Brienomyrus brachyistius]